MKIRFVFFLVFLGCFCISKSGLIYKCIPLFTGMDFLSVHGRTAAQKKSKGAIPFQGKKMFCSADSRAKYIITITNDSVLIAIDRIKIKGVLKKDKLFTDDPREVEYRRFSHAYYGKYFVIGTDYFSILNSENGEYSYYTLCK
jgi:hypothetical protein